MPGSTAEWVLTLAPPRRLHAAPRAERAARRQGAVRRPRRGRTRTASRSGPAQDQVGDPRRPADRCRARPPRARRTAPTRSATDSQSRAHRARSLAASASSTWRPASVGLSAGPAGCTSATSSSRTRPARIVAIEFGDPAYPGYSRPTATNPQTIGQAADLWLLDTRTARPHPRPRIPDPRVAQAVRRRVDRRRPPRHRSPRRQLLPIDDTNRDRRLAPRTARPTRRHPAAPQRLHQPNTPHRLATAAEPAARSRLLRNQQRRPYAAITRPHAVGPRVAASRAEEQPAGARGQRLLWWRSSKRGAASWFLHRSAAGCCRGPGA